MFRQRACEFCKELQFFLTALLWLKNKMHECQKSLQNTYSYFEQVLKILWLALWFQFLVLVTCLGVSLMDGFAASSIGPRQLPSTTLQFSFQESLCCVCHSKSTRKCKFTKYFSVVDWLLQTFLKRQRDSFVISWTFLVAIVQRF